MINVAIVGTGSISNLHIKGLLEFKDRCKIVALCDIYPEKAEDTKKRYDLDCEVFDNHKSMLESGIKIDVVHVCTPPYVHASISIDCMDKGCNVLCEKPMAPSVEECDRMLEAQRRNNVTLGAIAQNRFRNEVYKLKKVLDSGLVGKLKFIQVNSLWWRDHCYYDLWWRGTWEKEGGGCTLNHAVHHIDMLNWMTGKAPKEVMSMLTNVCHDNAEVEDLSVACVRYDDNSIANIISSVISHGEEQGIVIQCEKAKISMPWDIKAEIGMENGFPKEERNQELIKEVTDFYNDLPDLCYEAHTGEIDNFLTAIENKTEPMITGEDGKRTIELITGIYASGFEKKTLSLPFKEDSVYYKEGGILKNAVHFYEKTTSIENFSEQRITVGNYKK